MLAAVNGRYTGVVEFNGAGLFGVFFKGFTGVEQGLGVGHHQYVAVITDVEFFVGLDNVEARTAGFKGIIGSDVSFLKHKASGAIGEVKAARNFVIAFVDTVADAEPGKRVASPFPEAES